MQRAHYNMSIEAPERAVRSLSVEYRPAEVLPEFSLNGILHDARAHIDKRTANGQSTVSRKTAIDNILRMPGRPTLTDSGTVIPVRQPDFHVDPQLARQRQDAGVPSFIDPQALFGALSSELLGHKLQRANQIAEAKKSDYRFPFPENEHDMDKLQQRLREEQQRYNPLRLYYDASIALLEQEWAIRDHMDRHGEKAAQASASVSETVAAAEREHRLALELDRPTPFPTASVVYKANA